MSEFPKQRLDEFIADGSVLLGRGDVISKDDIDAHPGPYPIYSSSAHNNGKFGEYGKFMFDEELITWSVDGGGYFFYRPKHKYSVTNVCGYMRLRGEKLYPKFVYYSLANQHRYLTFDYTTKAHPSVIKKQYWLPTIAREQQQKIASILTNIDATIEKTEALIVKYQQIKAGLMHDLFTRGATADGKLRPPREQVPELYQETPIGWMPKEWDVGELKNWLAYLSYGFTNPMPESDEGPYMVTAADVSLGRIQYDTCRRTTRDAFDRLLTQKSRPKIGDVLLTKDGTLGRVAIVDRTDVCINQSVAVLRPKDLQHSKFIATMLSAPMWQAKMLSDAGGSAIKHIYITVIDKMLVAWPKRPDELLAIYTQIENCTAKTEHEEAYLEKLRQQKLGLMHDLLSGSIRVAL